MQAKPTHAVDLRFGKLDAGGSNEPFLAPRLVMASTTVYNLTLEIEQIAGSDDRLVHRFSARHGVDSVG